MEGRIKYMDGWHNAIAKPKHAKSALKRTFSTGGFSFGLARKKVGFNQANVIQTSHMPTSQRTYGFFKATKTATPFPKAASKLDDNALSARLQAQLALPESEQKFYKVSSSDSSDKTATREPKKSLDSKSLSFHVPFPIENNLTFEMRRKLFDEAEFTIAKGKKLSDNIHPNFDPDDLLEFGSAGGAKGDKDGQSIDSQGPSFKHMKRLCRELNIELSKGYFI